jgi:hypothetical protein
LFKQHALYWLGGNPDAQRLAVRPRQSSGTIAFPIAFATRPFLRLYMPTISLSSASA